MAAGATIQPRAPIVETWAIVSAWRSGIPVGDGDRSLERLFQPPIRFVRRAEVSQGAGGGPAARRPMRVLCIEDTRTNFEILRLYLARQQGYEVFGAEDGERGLEVAARERPDVILLDINLPGMDGIEVKARLAADPRTAAIPVIALSAGALKTDIDRALAAGFVEYLTKPLRLPRLTETLDRCVARSG